MGNGDYSQERRWLRERYMSANGDALEFGSVIAGTERQIAVVTIFDGAPDVTEVVIRYDNGGCTVFERSDAPVNKRSYI